MGVWKGVVIGFIAALVLLAIGAYCYFGFGLAPVATASDPMPFEKFLANRALHAVVLKPPTSHRPLTRVNPTSKAAPTCTANIAPCVTGSPAGDDPHREGNVPESPATFPRQGGHGRSCRRDVLEGPKRHSPYRNARLSRRPDRRPDVAGQSASGQRRQASGQRSRRVGPQTVTDRSMRSRSATSYSRSSAGSRAASRRPRPSRRPSAARRRSRPARRVPARSPPRRPAPGWRSRRRSRRPRERP